MNRWKYRKAKRRGYLLVESVVAIAILTGLLSLFSKSFFEQKKTQKLLEDVELLAREEACLAAAKKWLLENVVGSEKLLSTEGVVAELEVKGPLLSIGESGLVTQKVKARISKVGKDHTLEGKRRVLVAVTIPGAKKRKSPTFEVALKN